MSQTANGVTTQYTLDLNAGLTQVLTDGTNTYLYGRGRIAEEAQTEWDYYLADALGSVRQITNEAGAITLLQSYDPFGQVLTSVGNADSVYGYTGEMLDGTGMQYLRARYYAPVTGRFVSKDSWKGSYKQPITLNSWLYGNLNPINFSDPSGNCVFCKSGDFVKVDARRYKNKLLEIKKDNPTGYTPVIALAKHQDKVEILDEENSSCRWSYANKYCYRKVRYESVHSENEFMHTFVEGWVLNNDLLDNCEGPIGTFGCLPTDTRYLRRVYGFGPNQFAYDDWDATGGIYDGTRGLHNGMDFSVDPGQPLVWGGTSSSKIEFHRGDYEDQTYNFRDADAPGNFAIPFPGHPNVWVLFGHQDTHYPALNDEILPGQTIGEVGTAADHIHFAVRDYSTFYNPLYFFSPSLHITMLRRMQPYYGSYNAYSMYSFDNTVGGNFWEDNCSSEGIVWGQGWEQFFRR